MLLGRFAFLLVGMTLLAQDRVSLGANQFSIEAPKGFVAMPPDVRLRIFPAGDGPAYIFRYSEGDATATFDTLKQQYAKKDLPNMKAQSEAAIGADKRPLRWVAREMTKLLGRPCIHLEYVRTTDSGEMHHDQYYVLEGKGLSLLSYSSPDKDFARYEQQFQRSRASIRFAR